jgi:hypothetical protein
MQRSPLLSLLRWLPTSLGKMSWGSLYSDGPYQR